MRFGPPSERWRPRFFSQGQWKNKFNKDNVYLSDFHVSDSRTCSVDMMYQETKFRYRHFHDDQVQLLEMPYRGDDITMVIILPSRDVPLSQVILTALPTLVVHLPGCSLKKNVQMWTCGCVFSMCVCVC